MRTWLVRERVDRGSARADDILEDLRQGRMSLVFPSADLIRSTELLGRRISAG